MAGQPPKRGRIVNGYIARPGMGMSGVEEVDDDNRYEGQRRSGLEAKNFGVPPARVQDIHSMPARHFAQPRRGLILTKGRLDPQHEQSIVTKQFRFAHTTYDQRAKTNQKDMIAPLGSKDAFSLMKGQLLFAEVKDGPTTVTNYINKNFQGIHGFGDVLVFDCVNGLPKNAKIMCVGVCKTEVRATTENFDEAVTSTLKGTQTIINRGPCQLQAMQRIGFLMTPLMIQDKNGNLMPAVKQEELPADKFCPTIFPMDEISGAPATARANNAAKQAVLDRGNNMTWNDFADVAAAAERLFRQHTFLMAGDQKSAENQRFIADDMPLDRYVPWQVFTLMMTRLGVGAGMEQVLQSLNDRHLAAISPSTVSDKITVRSDFPVSGSPNYETELSAFLEHRKAMCVHDQVAWAEQRYIATVMNNCGPGAQLDIHVDVV